MESGKLFDAIPVGLLSEEVFTELLARPGLSMERIVSTGQCSPEGFWYDQPQGEWVLVLTGLARLQLEGEAEARTLGPGDWLDIPPHTRHRVAFTHPEQPTVWLAVHYGDVPG